MEADKSKELQGLVRKLTEVAMGGMEAQDYFIMLATRGLHNTEEQRLFKLVARLIKARAESDSFVDGRNEAAHNWCKAVMAAIPDPYFPFI